MFDEVIAFIRSLYGDGFIPLHEPRFIGNEKKYVLDCIDSTFVSSVGKYVDQFEKMICETTGSKFAVATMNGTSALHMGLMIADVRDRDEVLTQALTFVATANAISYIGASPVFLDSAEDNLGLCPESLKKFLLNYAEKRSDGFTYNKLTQKRIKACVPMHVFGHPVKLNEIIQICDSYNITVIEDAAESLGSYYHGKHTGTIAPIGILSFNGNKIVTSGGGGAILLQDEAMAKRAKHLTTTAKIPHRWEFNHDEIGYNYRLPNLNASLLCAQIEMLPQFIKNKRETAKKYKEHFLSTGISFVSEPDGCESNYWLNALIFNDKKTQQEFLKISNDSGVMTRPIWKLMPDLMMFKNSQTSDLVNARKYESTVVNIPSSVVL
jgi:aminotransferase in exopolysaccharide biosynthesis